MAFKVTWTDPDQGEEVIDASAFEENGTWTDFFVGDSTHTSELVTRVRSADIRRIDGQA